MTRISAATALLCATPLVSCAGAFMAPQAATARISFLSAAGKGFGDSKVPSQTPKKVVASPPPEPALVDNPFEATSSDPEDLNAGQRALAKMRRERAEARNAELQQMKAVQDTDRLLREQPGAAAIPEKVAQRMGKRMLPFVGIPLFGGMAAFVGFWYMATYRNLEFEPVTVAASTIALLAVGLVGITYSVMSASWDPDREGDAIGVQEFQRNLDNIKTGLGRSRDNARLREEMAYVPPEEFELLDKAANKSERRKQTLRDKIGD